VNVSGSCPLVASRTDSPSSVRCYVENYVPNTQRFSTFFFPESGYPMALVYNHCR
jgi:hypothetical protein